MKNSNNDDKFLSEDPFEQIDEYIANVNKILSDNEVVNPNVQQDDNEEGSTNKQPDNKAKESPKTEPIEEKDDLKDNSKDVEISENTEVLEEPVKIEKNKKTGNKKGDKKGKNRSNQKPVRKEDGASRGLKTLGIISIFLVIMGAVLIGIAVYKLVVNPDYEKKDVSAEISYPYLPPETDAYSDIVPLSTTTDATATDATAGDANAADTTDTAADEPADEAQN